MPLPGQNKPEAGPRFFHYVEGAIDRLGMAQHLLTIGWEQGWLVVDETRELDEPIQVLIQQLGK